MKVGDPKKAAVLAVVALIIICAGVFEAIPKGPKPLPQITAAQNPAGTQPANPPAAGQQAGTTSVPAKGPEPAVSATLKVDPFSNPKLAPLKKDDKGNIVKHDDKPGSDLQQLDDSGKPQKHVKSAGLVATDPGAMQGNVPPFNPVPGVTPDKSAGNSQDQLVKQPDTITLQGVVKVEHSIAFIVVDGGSAIRCKAGDIIADQLVKVVSVGDSGVTVKTSKKTFALRVGETKKL